MSSSISVTSTSVSAYTSSSGGCVTCGTSPACPTCASDEICVQTELTCTQCPTTKCVKRTTSSGTTSSSSNSRLVGGVVGGVVGGIAVLVALLLFFLYHRYWKVKLKERSDRLNAARSIYYEDEVSEDDDEEAGDDDSDVDGGAENVAAYANYKRPIKSTASTVGDRNSAITTQTRASNLLPIAYIPGVTNGSGTVSGSGSGGLTSRLFRGLNTSHLNNPGDIRSHITLGSSILGGMDDEDEELQVPEKSAGKSASSPNEKSVEDLTTAIRAKPKLVQIAEEDPDQEKRTDSTVQEYELSEKQPDSQDSQSQDRQDEHAALRVDTQNGGEPVQHNNVDDNDKDDDDDDDDDDGSFILDLAIPDSIRPNSKPNGTKAGDDNLGADSGSPFEDKFRIDEDM